MEMVLPALASEMPLAPTRDETSGAETISVVLLNPRLMAPVPDRVREFDVDCELVVPVVLPTAKNADEVPACGEAEIVIEFDEALSVMLSPPTDSYRRSDPSSSRQYCR